MKTVKSEPFNSTDKKPLKILIVNYEFPPVGGGGGVASNDLALEWVKSAQVDVLTMHFKNLPRFEVRDGMNIYRTTALFRKSRDVTPFITMLTYVISAVFKGIYLAAKNHYDVINTHFAVPTGPVGWVISRLFRITNVLSLHGGDIYDPSKKMSPHKSGFYRKVIRFIINSADAVVAQSTNTRDNAVKYYDIKRGIDIIPLPFHFPPDMKADRKETGMDKNAFWLITIGRLIKRKDMDTMFRGIAGAGIPSIKLAVLGDGPELEHLKELAGELGISDRILFRGYVSDAEKFRCLNAADCYIMTSLHEGFGIVFMEAMSCGLPVISTNHGGQTDFLTDGKTGRLINVGDSEGCADAIRQLYTDKQLYRKCSMFNKKTVKQFDASLVADRYYAVFMKLASGRQE